MTLAHPFAPSQNSQNKTRLKARPPPLQKTHLWGLDDEQRHNDGELQQDEQEGDDQLSAGGHEARLLGADLLLAACQDASDAVGLRSKIDQELIELAGTKYRNTYR